jgi:flagellar biosynthesis/type III secretory pathway M-ring protein FliF/YscJ
LRDLDVPGKRKALVQKLQELKVLYELSADGRSIKVASDQTCRNSPSSFASQGLPESGRIGLRRFSNRANFGLTKFSGDGAINQRAMEGVVSAKHHDAGRSRRQRACTLVLAMESPIPNA